MGSSILFYAFTVLLVASAVVSGNEINRMYHDIMQDRMMDTVQTSDTSAAVQNQNEATGRVRDYMLARDVAAMFKPIKRSMQLLDSYVDKLGSNFKKSYRNSARAVEKTNIMGAGLTIERPRGGREILLKDYASKERRRMMGGRPRGGKRGCNDAEGYRPRGGKRELCDENVKTGNL